MGSVKQGWLDTVKTVCAYCKKRVVDWHPDRAFEAECEDCENNRCFNEAVDKD